MDIPAADAVEVEIKAPLTDVGTFRRNLELHGAKSIEHWDQRDRYYDHPVRSFEETDEALRVRVDGEGVRLTYKGPKLDEQTKTRRQIEVHVDDEETLTSLLEALGFEEAGTVSKTRAVYELDDFHVTVDEVEGLGSYVEVETVVSEEEVDEARKELLGMAEELDLRELERRSYLEMLLEKGGTGDDG